MRAITLRLELLLRAMALAAIVGWAVGEISIPDAHAAVTSKPTKKPRPTPALPPSISPSTPSTWTPTSSPIEGGFDSFTPTASPVIPPTTRPSKSPPTTPVETPAPTSKKKTASPTTPPTFSNSPTQKPTPPIVVPELISAYVTDADQFSTLRLAYDSVIVASDLLAPLGKAFACTNLFESTDEANYVLGSLDSDAALCYVTATKGDDGASPSSRTSTVTIPLSGSSLVMPGDVITIANGSFVSARNDAAVTSRADAVVTTVISSPSPSKAVIPLAKLGSRVVSACPESLVVLDASSSSRGLLRPFTSVQFSVLVPPPGASLEEIAFVETQLVTNRVGLRTSFSPSPNLTVPNRSWTIQVVLTNWVGFFSNDTTSVTMPESLSSGGGGDDSSTPAANFSVQIVPANNIPTVNTKKNGNMNGWIVRFMGTVTLSPADLDTLSASSAGSSTASSSSSPSSSCSNGNGGKNNHNNNNNNNKQNNNNSDTSTLGAFPSRVNWNWNVTASDGTPIALASRAEMMAFTIPLGLSPNVILTLHADALLIFANIGPRAAPPSSASLSLSSDLVLSVAQAFATLPPPPPVYLDVGGGNRTVFGTLSKGAGSVVTLTIRSPPKRLYNVVWSCVLVTGEDCEGDFPPPIPTNSTRLDIPVSAVNDTLFVSVSGLIDGSRAVATSQYPVYLTPPGASAVAASVLVGNSLPQYQITSSFKNGLVSPVAKVILTAVPLSPSSSPAPPRLMWIQTQGDLTDDDLDSLNTNRLTLVIPPLVLNPGVTYTFELDGVWGSGSLNAIAKGKKPAGNGVVVVALVSITFTVAESQVDTSFASVEVSPLNGTAGITVFRIDSLNFISTAPPDDLPSLGDEGDDDPSDTEELPVAGLVLYEYYIAPCGLNDGDSNNNKTGKNNNARRSLASAYQPLSSGQTVASSVGTVLPAGAWSISVLALDRLGVVSTSRVVAASCVQVDSADDASQVLDLAAEVAESDVSDFTDSVAWSAAAALGQLSGLEQKGANKVTARDLSLRILSLVADSALTLARDVNSSDAGGPEDAVSPSDALDGLAIRQRAVQEASLNATGETRHAVLTAASHVVNAAAGVAQYSQSLAATDDGDDGDGGDYGPSSFDLTDDPGSDDASTATTDEDAVMVQHVVEDVVSTMANVIASLGMDANRSNDSLAEGGADALRLVLGDVGRLASASMQPGEPELLVVAPAAGSSGVALRVAFKVESADFVAANGLPLANETAELLPLASFTPHPARVRACQSGVVSTNPLASNRSLNHTTLLSDVVSLEFFDHDTGARLVLSNAGGVNATAVVLKLPRRRYLSANSSRGEGLHCGAFDYTSGLWSSEGCYLEVPPGDDDDGDTLLCSCTHASDYTAWLQTGELITMIFSDVDFANAANGWLMVFVLVLLVVGTLGLMALGRARDERDMRRFIRGIMISLKYVRLRERARARRILLNWRNYVASTPDDGLSIVVYDDQPSQQQPPSQVGTEEVNDMSDSRARRRARWIKFKRGIIFEHTLISSVFRFDAFLTRQHRVVLGSVVVLGEMLVAAIFYYINNDPSVSFGTQFAVSVLSVVLVSPVVVLYTVMIKQITARPGVRRDYLQQIMALFFAEVPEAGGEVSDDVEEWAAYARNLNLRDIELVHRYQGLKLQLKHLRREWAIKHAREAEGGDAAGETSPTPRRSLSFRRSSLLMMQSPSLSAAGLSPTKSGMRSPLSRLSSSSPTPRRASRMKRFESTEVKIEDVERELAALRQTLLRRWRRGGGEKADGGEDVDERSFNAPVPSHKRVSDLPISRETKVWLEASSSPSHQTKPSSPSSGGVLNNKSLLRLSGRFGSEGSFSRGGEELLLADRPASGGEPVPSKPVPLTPAPLRRASTKHRLQSSEADEENQKCEVTFGEETEEVEVEPSRAWWERPIYYLRSRVPEHNFGEPSHKRRSHRYIYVIYAVLGVYYAVAFYVVLAFGFVEGSVTVGNWLPSVIMSIVLDLVLFQPVLILVRYVWMDDLVHFVEKKRALRRSSSSSSSSAYNNRSHGKTTEDDDDDGDRVVSDDEEARERATAATATETTTIAQELCDPSPANKDVGFRARLLEARDSDEIAESERREAQEVSKSEEVSLEASTSGEEEPPPTLNDTSSLILV